MFLVTNENMGLCLYMHTYNEYWMCSKMRELTNLNWNMEIWKYQKVYQNQKDKSSTKFKHLLKQ